MNIQLDKICYDLLAIPLEDGILDLSWSVDTDSLMEILKDNYSIDKILNFQDKIDFSIQIDSVNTFDSINLKEFKFSSIEKSYRGNIVFSTIIPFNNNKFEETNYFFRVKLTNDSINYNTFSGDVENISSIQFEDEWSDALSFTIPKNYTKDLVEAMYRTVADFNAYNKEAKSANFYYLFQALATSLNEEFTYIQNVKNSKLINKSLPDDLMNTFGVLFKFTDAYGLTMEEYRRIIRNLILGYQNGGAWNYIKNVIKYCIGYTPKLVTFDNFYPWILRKSSIEDPIWSERNYYNPQTNYYLYKSEFNQQKNKNQIMFLNKGENTFSFIVRSDNFFNRDINNEKIKTILNLLKSSYTKYIIDIDKKIEPTDFTNYLYIDDNTFLLANDEFYIAY